MRPPVSCLWFQGFMAEVHEAQERAGQPAARRVPVWAWGVAGLLVLVVAAALFVPPVALVRRLGGAYVTLDATHPAYFHPDGLAVSLVDGSSRSLSVEVTSLPREAFLDDAAGGAWQRARAALPGGLVPLSPIYTLRTLGRVPLAAEMAIPNNAEPLERLALYRWNARAGIWEFVPSRVDVVRQIIAFQPEAPFFSVMAVHVELAEPVIALVISPGSSAAGIEIDLALPEGVHIDEAGALVGLPAEVAAPAVLPLVENRIGGVTTYVEPVRQNLLGELLPLAAAYDGLALDFAEGAGYTGFIAALAEQLHAQGKALHVVLRPADLAEGDLSGLGRAAHDPAAYTEGGAVGEMLARLVNQVDRSRAGLLVGSFSVDMASAGSVPLSFEQAAALFGEVQVVPGYLDAGTSQVIAGSILPLRLTARVESMGFDAALGMSYLTYHDETGDLHHVYLASAQDLARRLEWVRRYALGAVAVSGLAYPDAPDGLEAGLTAFLSEQPAGAPAELSIVWQVQPPSGQPGTEQVGGLDLLQYVWDVPAEPGQYTLLALVRAGAEESLRGQVTVEVIQSGSASPAGEDRVLFSIPLLGAAASVEGAG